MRTVLSGPEEGSGRYGDTQADLLKENGPTIVGDRNSDPTLMEHLCARKITQPGNDFPEYRTDDPPRTVLNKLELMGYRVVAMSGIGQTCIWTLHKQ
ncbi:GTP cyclohydrolase 1 feedback regulatory protein isoform X2 [Rhipicephalus microplus]|uniref:GTP cyclohydrolase 1 feedback regulatory protein isoform X2 n=1 Tax=Rhipicephalus microplus TaxID=6941 RepID=UPI003F6D45C5